DTSINTRPPVRKPRTSPSGSSSWRNSSPSTYADFYNPILVSPAAELHEKTAPKGGFLLSQLFLALAAVAQQRGQVFAVARADGAAVFVQMGDDFVNLSGKRLGIAQKQLAPHGFVELCHAGQILVAA